MRVWLGIALACALAASGLAEDKKPKTADQLYKEVGGLWRPVDEKKPLETFWLHQGEKAPAGQEGTPWRIHLAFSHRSADDYIGPPVKVEVEGEGLKITLVPAGEGGTCPSESCTCKRKATDSNCG
jgi:hypothetical protein